MANKTREGVDMRRGFATVAVALSGGVDSSVSALLLQRQGHRVFGMHMRNWDEVEERGACSGEEDLASARRVSSDLGLALHEVRVWPDL